MSHVNLTQDYRSRPTVQTQQVVRKDIVSMLLANKEVHEIQNKPQNTQLLDAR